MGRDGRMARATNLTGSSRVSICFQGSRGGPARCDRGVIMALRCVSFRHVNAFHVIGGLTALWALLVSFLGVTRERFPGSGATERIVAVISVLLVAGSIGSAIVTSALEEEGETEGGEEAALVLPL